MTVHHAMRVLSVCCLYLAGTHVKRKHLVLQHATTAERFYTLVRVYHEGMAVVKVSSSTLYQVPGTAFLLIALSHVLVLGTRRIMLRGGQLLRHSHYHASSSL